MSENAPPQVPELNPVQRRIVGVLVEKARTTPDAYPMTLSAITTGCNQKSNRHPKMNLDPDDVLVELDNLRSMEVVEELHGVGRVPKYRHHFYTWLNIEPTEGAVLAELLLRGPQTVGELRGRAARMASIADVAALRPILDGLIARRLVVPLTPAGRGQVVTHGLYLAREWPRVREAFADAESGSTQPRGGGASGPPDDSADGEILETIRAEIRELAQQMARLEARITQLESRIGS